MTRPDVVTGDLQGQPTLDLSLIVPCYNESQHLRASVRAVVEVLERSPWSWEIVFVDDGSADGTRAIVRELCAADPRCRFIFHATNRGRGAAFKTGFASSEGRITGFIDIDLEVHARFIPDLVHALERHGDDVVTGRRYYSLRQTGALHRAALSWAYRRVCDVLLSLELEDTETGFKFFRRATATHAVLSSENDGWFWDTEVMARARLANLRIREVPVLFLRRGDKSSTVRIWRDSWRSLRALHDFRGVIGLSRRAKSPIYWTGHGYDLVMRALYRAEYRQTHSEVAAQIPDGASVVDVCCGTARLYRDFLRGRGCTYLGLDYNGDFVMHARHRGVDVRWFNVLDDPIPPIPPGDYLVMCSSLYHFGTTADAVLTRLRQAARRAVIVSEPVRNLSSLPLVGGLAARFADPGVGTHTMRFDRASFRALVLRHGGTLVHTASQRNALAVFASSATPARQPSPSPSPSPAR
jgi:glycosyltransferase involved in cell wall biosynthesis